MADIRATGLRLARELGPIGLVVVDYLQLVSPDRDGVRRGAELAEVSRGLKALALPVLALATLPPDVDRRFERLPTLADLPGGAHDTDADAVLLIQAGPPSGNHRRRAPTPTRLIVAKQRHGPIYSIWSILYDRHVRFMDVTTQESLLLECRFT